MNKEWFEEVRLITSTRRSRTLGAFEMAPLVDVMLMLVIFALMVTGFVYQPGVQVDLPVLSNPDAIKGRTLNVGVTREEQVFIAGNPIPVTLQEAISAQLIAFHRHNPDGTVLINADYNVRHGYLLELVQLIRDSGLNKIAFAGINKSDSKTENNKSNSNDASNAK